MSMVKGIDGTKKIRKNVSRIPKRSRLTHEGFRLDIGHSSVQEKQTNVI